MFAIVSAFTEDELKIVACELKRGGHVLIGERPVAKLIVEVIFPILEEHFKRLFVSLANERRIDMAESFSCSSVTFLSPTLFVEIKTMPSS